MISIVKISLKVMGFATLLATTSVFATDITVGGTTVIVDDRESAGDTDASGDDRIFNIDQMNVSWASNETITVDIFTNFANTNSNGITNNNYWSEGERNKIVYGDLLMSVGNGSGGSSYYAFKLGADRWNRGNVNPLTSTGGLYAINGVYTAGQYHGTNKTGYVFGKQANDVKLGTNTSWGTSQSTNQWGVNQGKVSFSFNVAGLDMFQNATSLGLSWAMSCFNDNVGGTYAVQRNSPVVGVPEPSTVLLMLLALGGLVYRRRNTSENFTA